MCSGGAEPGGRRRRASPHGCALRLPGTFGHVTSTGGACSRGSRIRAGWKEPPAASWECSSGASKWKGLLVFTCLHVLRNTTGPCFQMSPHSRAFLHLCVDSGGTPGRCRRARRAWSCRRLPSRSSPGQPASPAGPAHSPVL